MLLTLFRHGKSDWTDNPPDLDRPLAPRGRAQAPVTARWLAHNMPPIDAALVSPAVRTRQTFDHMTPQWSNTVRHHIVQSLYTDDGDDVVLAAAQFTSVVQHGVIVGHNPALEEAVEFLTGDIVTLKTSACAVIELSGTAHNLTPRCGTLLYSGRPTTV